MTASEVFLICFSIPAGLCCGLAFGLYVLTMLGVIGR